MRQRFTHPCFTSNVSNQTLRARSFVDPLPSFWQQLLLFTAQNANPNDLFKDTRDNIFELTLNFKQFLMLIFQKAQDLLKDQKYSLPWDFSNLASFSKKNLNHEMLLSLLKKNVLFRLFFSLVKLLLFLLLFSSSHSCVSRKFCSSFCFCSPTNGVNDNIILNFMKAPDCVFVCYLCNEATHEITLIINLRW